MEKIDEDIEELDYFGCGICDKMQVVYMELTRDGVTSKIANSEFDCYKASKLIRTAWKINLQ